MNSMIGIYKKHKGNKWRFEIYYYGYLDKTIVSSSYVIGYFKCLAYKYLKNRSNSEDIHVRNVEYR